MGRRVELEAREANRCCCWGPERVQARSVESAAGMKIAVLAKAVPEHARRIDPASKRLDRSGEPVLNPFDAHAVEEALRLKGDDAGSEVVLVSLGPERAIDALRKALAMGADRVVLVTDEAAAGADLVATTAALAEVLEREQPDLVLLGQQSTDGGGASLWAALADRLRRPLISQVAELTVADGTLRGKRQTEYGYDVIEAPLPAVIAVSDAINEPRYPSLKAIMGAKKKPLDTKATGDVGIDAGEVGEAGSKTQVLEIAPPPEKQAGEIIEDEDTNETVEKIVAWLDERKLI